MGNQQIQVVLYMGKVYGWAATQDAAKSYIAARATTIFGNVMWTKSGKYMVRESHWEGRGTKGKQRRREVLAWRWTGWEIVQTDKAW